jgi:hypothetical protein
LTVGGRDGEAPGLTTEPQRSDSRPQVLMRYERVRSLVGLSLLVGRRPTSRGDNRVSKVHETPPSWAIQAAEERAAKLLRCGDEDGLALALIEDAWAIVEAVNEALGDPDVTMESIRREAGAMTSTETEKHLDLAYDLSAGAWLLSPDDSAGNAYIIHLPNPGTPNVMPNRYDLARNHMIAETLAPWAKAGWSYWRIDEDELYHFIVDGIDSYPCPGCSKPAEG